MAQELSCGCRDESRGQLLRAIQKPDFQDGTSGTVACQAIIKLLIKHHVTLLLTGKCSLMTCCHKFVNSVGFARLEDHGQSWQECCCRCLARYVTRTRLVYRRCGITPMSTVTLTQINHRDLLLSQS